MSPKVKELVQRILEIIRTQENYLKSLRDHDIDPKEVLKNKIKFKLDLNKINISGNKSKDQINTLQNMKIFLMQNIIKFCRNHTFMLSEPEDIVKYGKGLKIGNTCENLLNEICQIKHFFCRAKEITKKVYNNIMNLIKL